MAPILPRSAGILGEALPPIPAGELGPGLDPLRAATLSGGAAAHELSGLNQALALIKGITHLQGILIHTQIFALL